mgnify:CR=1 FL=1
MHRQLQPIVDDYRAASARLHALVEATPVSAWADRPDPDRWSMAECVAHLNLTGAAVVPLMQRAVDEGRQMPRSAAGTSYRRDFTGWMLWRMTGPPARMKMKTIDRFVPSGEAPATALLAEFENWQQLQIRCVEEADGLPLMKIQITSPFNPKMRYNLYSCFSMLPRHEHRHIWQAEQVWAALQRRGIG